MVELDSEGHLARTDVADFLREFADELDGGTREGRERQERRDEGTTTRSERGPEVSPDTTEDSGTAERTEERSESRPPREDASDTQRITLIVGGDSATVTVPESVMFDVEVGSRSPMLSSGVKQEIDFSLSWQIENPDEISEDWLEIE